MAATNWAGNHVYRARLIHAPSTLEHVREIVAAAPRVRVLGSRHSFTDIADSVELLTLDAVAPDVVVDRDAMTVTLGGAMRYGEVAVELTREGLALSNLASLPHIAVAGAVSTAVRAPAPPLSLKRSGARSAGWSECSPRSGPGRTGASCSSPAPARSARCTSGSAISVPCSTASTRAARFATTG